MRTSVPAPLVVALLVVLTGCAGPLSPSTPGEETTTTTPADTTTKRYLTAVPPGERLVLRAAENTTVVVKEFASDAKHNRTAIVTYDLAAGETVKVDEFRVEGWIVLSIDGQSAWEGFIGQSNHVEFRVYPDGTVKVTDSYVV